MAFVFQEPPFILAGPRAKTCRGEGDIFGPTMQGPHSRSFTHSTAAGSGPGKSKRCEGRNPTVPPPQQLRGMFAHMGLPPHGKSPQSTTGSVAQGCSEHPCVDVPSISQRHGWQSRENSPAGKSLNRYRQGRSASRRPQIATDRLQATHGYHWDNAPSLSKNSSDMIFLGGKKNSNLEWLPKYVCPWKGLFSLTAGFTVF